MARVLTGAGAALRRFFFPDRGVLQPRPYAVVAAIGLAVGLALAFSDQTQRLDWNLYDRSVSLATRDAEPAPGIVVVAIDEPSFGEIGLQWPWPRRLHAALIDRLTRGGARTIVLDILFDVPAANPEDDAALIDAVGRAGNVVLATDLATVEDRTYSVTQWVEPLPGLAEAARALGVDRLPYDPDRVLRQTALVVEGRPTLAAAAVRTLPADPERSRLIPFNGPPRRGIRTVSYYQALEAERLLPKDIFRDKVVLVGRSLAATTIDEQADHFMTPVAVQMGGVEVHATIVDALLRDRFIRDPFDRPLALVLLIVVAGAAAAMPLYRLGPIAAAFGLAAVAVLLVVAGYGAIAGVNLRLPILPLIAALTGVYATTAAYRFALVSRERRIIKRAFQHYVAPAIVEQMLNDPSKLRLGGEEYEVSVIFTDLEGFTTLSERLTPEALRAHLSGYFKEMMDLLLAERATLDKFIGDAIMVYFGCPIRDPTHAAQACRAALAMQTRMVDLNRQWAAEGLPKLRMRVGINTGRAVAGNMGTDSIFNFTILGDCVNLASRLEGVNKEYGSLILIGEDTLEQVRGQFEVREIDWIRVKGKERPVAIYELVAPAGQLADARREAFRRFAEGLALYRRMFWEAAAAEFRVALDLDPHDGPSAAFLTRCQHYAMEPPPPAWDGVHVMRTK